jgi:hypothetical protein
LALSEAQPGTKVAAVRWSGHRAGTSSSARLELSYVQAFAQADARLCAHHYAQPNALPPTLYIKGGFAAPMRRRVWGGLETEARFFQRVAPGLRIHMPRAFFAGVDTENRQAIVILEDLAVRNVSFGHATQPLGADAMARLMALLAKLHAPWWQRPGLGNWVAGAGPQRLYVKYLLRPASWAAVLERPYAHLIPPALREATVVGQALDRLWALNDSRAQTLLHGDTHPGNLFFERDGTPGLMDWQCAQQGHWAHDVMWAIVCAMGIEERRHHERPLIEHYLAELAHHGVTAPPFDEAWLAYRQNVMYGVSCGVANPYDMQTEEVTRLSAERILAAAVDLESARALGFA